jgi:tetratricopeptide (TPR) repeat protein
MKILIACTVLTLAFLLSASAQSDMDQFPLGVRTPRASATPRAVNPTAGNTFLSGNVVVEDGTPLTEAAAIQTICKGQKRTETYTDSHGSFTFEFASRASAANSALGDASTTVARGSRRDTRDCELQAVLPGFSSDVIQLGDRVAGLDGSDIGRVVLHRLNHVEGFTISVTSALAPAKAQKALEKGRELGKKGKWDEAQKWLQKAVEIYPKYAVAWFELGRVLGQKNDLEGSRHSFGQALEADPKYVSPYQGLAQLAARANHWQELVDVTSKLLGLNPVDFPDAWLLNGVGNYYLKDFQAAERSARKGLELDEAHHVPKIEYLMAMILVRQHDYQQAAMHMQQYLHLATKPADVDDAKKQLAEIARLSETASLPAESEKK